jgi:2-phospho-L-lactate transferase/gluconeogenesis factor (CofD/UPF0052 family)
MRSITRRLASLVHLSQPLALTFVGVVLISLGFAYLFVHAYRTVEGLPTFFYFLTLQFLPRSFRGILLLGAGIGVLAAGIWNLSGVVVIPVRDQQASPDGEIVLGYGKTKGPPRVVVISGGAGMLVLGNLADHVERLTCIVPVQDPVEYYYRASGLLSLQNVYYVVPTPSPLRVNATLDDRTTLDVRRLGLEPTIAERHVVQLALADEGTTTPPLSRLVRDAINEADAIILGPGSLFESILPNMLMEEFRDCIRTSHARKIYICNLMSEPGRTTGFGVADHIREIKHYGGFSPDYVLVNAQRIDADTYQLYAAANQSPVYLDPEEYEETTVLPGDPASRQRLLIEGSTVIEADLASSVIQYTASLDNPSASRGVRVLRHDGQKLTDAILTLLRRI